MSQFDLAAEPLRPPPAPCFIRFYSLCPLDHCSKAPIVLPALRAAPPAPISPTYFAKLVQFQLQLILNLFNAIFGHLPLDAATIAAAAKTLTALIGLGDEGPYGRIPYENIIER